MNQEIKNKISNSKKGTIPWNKGTKGLQIAWNKGLNGYMEGEKNGMYKHGLSQIKQRELLAGRPRGERCEICYKITLTDFDHDHSTGKFRGWLCRTCNLVLGLVKDRTEILRRLADYLDVQHDETRPKSILSNYALPTNNSNTESTST